MVFQNNIINFKEVQAQIAHWEQSAKGLPTSYSVDGVFWVCTGRAVDDLIAKEFDTDVQIALLTRKNVQQGTPLPVMTDALRTLKEHYGKGAYKFRKELDPSNSKACPTWRFVRIELVSVYRQLVLMQLGKLKKQGELLRIAHAIAA
jgi:hypothetical protein